MRFPVTQEARAELIRILDIIGISIPWPDTINGIKRHERFNKSLSNLMCMLGVEPFEAETTSHRGATVQKGG